MFKTSQFAIESYKVILTQHSNQNSRELLLVSPDLSHGIRYKATVQFDSSPNSYAKWNGVGIALNLGGANTDPIELTISCHSDLFDGFYQVLSNEKPVYLFFAYDNWPEDPNPQSTKKLIVLIQLLTDSELPGDFESRSRFITLQPAKV